MSNAGAEGAVRRVLRVAGWNALLLIAGLALIGLAGETLFRLKGRFTNINNPTVFVTDVGLMLPLRTEIRWTNFVDFWTTARTNSLGFLDREPPSPAQAAESCHIAVIGDSMVEAKEVQISEKFHVRLEEMAARELPALDVTTSAFGRSGTGQINQLAYYDEYARHLRPRLVVLVFVPNDFSNNFLLRRSVADGFDPEHRPYVSAERTEDGEFRLRPPDQDYLRFMVTPPDTFWWKLAKQISLRAWFPTYLNRKYSLLFRIRDQRERRFYERKIAQLEKLQLHPAYAPLLPELSAVEVTDSRNIQMLPEEIGGLVYTETLAFTAFALDEFKKRAEHDGAALVILAAHHMHRSRQKAALAMLSEMAAERRIPVVDQDDFIIRQGAERSDARWAHDAHWNLAGHRWAAGALLEYLKQNQELCE